MKQTELRIGHIPSLLWGEPTGHLLVAVHGNMSHKSDTVIALLAEYAVERGYQVFSFDLPEHGDRKSETTLCKVQTCVEELHTIMAYPKTIAQEISLFGCSMGAYFSLLAYCNEQLKQALFLSPVVDMKHLIQNMMTWFSVSEELLQIKGEVATPMGKMLYWDYYQYVKEHPVAGWDVPTKILYGSDDTLCERTIIDCFVVQFHCHLTVLEAGEHFFHTPAQLAHYEVWLKSSL